MQFQEVETLVILSPLPEERSHGTRQRITESSCALCRTINSIKASHSRPIMVTVGWAEQLECARQRRPQSRQFTLNESSTMGRPGLRLMIEFSVALCHNDNKASDSYSRRTALNPARLHMYSHVHFAIWQAKPTA